LEGRPDNFIPGSGQEEDGKVSFTIAFQGLPQRLGGGPAVPAGGIGDGDDDVFGVGGSIVGEFLQIEGEPPLGNR